MIGITVISWLVKVLVPVMVSRMNDRFPRCVYEEGLHNLVFSGTGN